MRPINDSENEDDATERERQFDRAQGVARKLHTMTLGALTIASQSENLKTREMLMAMGMFLSSMTADHFLAANKFFGPQDANQWVTIMLAQVAEVVGRSSDVTLKIDVETRLDA